MNWTERRKRKARRRLALRAVAGLSAGIAVAALAGLALGAEQLVSGQALLARPPETIWRVLLDLDGMPLWRSDLTALERLPDLAGRPAWREIGRDGARVMEILILEPPLRLVVRRAEAVRSSPAARTIQLVPTQGGTLVTVTERTLVRNPLYRVLNRLYPPRARIVRLLHDLEQRLTGSRREVVARPA